MSNYHKGYDCFLPDANTVQNMNCPICGQQMAVKRDQSGPRSWAAAMAGGNGNGELHDFFYCEQAHTPWHEQALKLYQGVEDSPSALVSEMLKKEIELIVQTQQTTK